MSKVWFVTGCSSGLGRTLSQRLLARGHRLIATAREPASLTDLLALAPDRCRAVALDVTNPEQIRGAIESAVTAFGRIDVLCSNAGYGLIAALEESSQEQIDRNMRTNLLGPIDLIRAALPHFRRQRSGHILVVSAIAALSNHEGFSIYGGAKAGLEAVCEALAIEVRPLGIKVTIVQPGPTRTDFAGRSLDTPANRIADYEQTSGKFGAFLSSIVGKQTGDPVRVCELMIDATESATPPLRLLTGKFAVNRARAKLAALASEIDSWESRSLAVDY